MRQLLVVILFTLTFSIAAAQNNRPANDSHTRKAVLVTGASSGIGREIALTLAARGFYVYAGARKQRDIAALSELENIEGIRLDVTIQTQIDDALASIRSRGRGLYGLVNNAGVFLFDPLIEVKEKDLQFIFDVNVMGPYRVTKTFAPLIMESKGRINTISSVAGITSGQLFGPYSMTKHAMESFSESLAQEMAKFDVRVSVVEPGNFRSDIMKNMQRRLQELQRGDRVSLYEDEVARFANFAAVDRSHHADPAPVAEAVYHFLTAEQPKFRYLVTPNQSEATLTIRRSLQKTIQLNSNQSYALSRDELVAIVDEMLEMSLP